jgi:hypothetical protein
MLYYNNKKDKNMTQENNKRDMADLSVKQQVGLWVILRELYDEKNRPFFSSEFSKKMKSYLNIDDEDTYRKTIGGILSALSKNNVLERVSSDRDPLWRLPDDIHNDPEYFKQQLKHIPHVTVEWQQ